MKTKCAMCRARSLRAVNVRLSSWFFFSFPFNFPSAFGCRYPHELFIFIFISLTSGSSKRGQRPFLEYLFSPCFSSPDFPLERLRVFIFLGILISPLNTFTKAKTASFSQNIVIVTHIFSFKQCLFTSSCLNEIFFQKIVFQETFNIPFFTVG